MSMEQLKAELYGSGHNPFKSSPDDMELVVNGHQTQMTPANLRTVMYMDAKRFFRWAGKFILAIAILYLLYHYFGSYGFISFLTFFVPCYFWVIPKIAERFMSYDSFVSVELHEDKPDVIRAIQIPAPRVQGIYVHDAKFFKSALNAPFNSRLGHTYIVDDINLDTDMARFGHVGKIADFIESHPRHSNVGFIMHTQNAFLSLREDYVALERDYFSLQAMLEVKVQELSDQKSLTLMDMMAHVNHRIEPPILDLSDSELSGRLANVEQFVSQLGLNLSNEDAVKKGYNLVSHIIRGGVPGES